jgi:hypothetical protein
MASATTATPTIPATLSAAILSAASALPPNWLELERQRAAAGRSYTNKAMFTLLLYLFLWIPGLIANLLYLGEAYETKKLTDTAPDGWGCLWLMLVIALSPVLLVCVGFLFASLGVGH